VPGFQLRASRTDFGKTIWPFEESLVVSISKPNPYQVRFK